MDQPPTHAPWRATLLILLAGLLIAVAAMSVLGLLLLRSSAADLTRAWYASHDAWCNQLDRTFDIMERSATLFAISIGETVAKPGTSDEWAARMTEYWI